MDAAYIPWLMVFWHIVPNVNGRGASRVEALFLFGTGNR